MKKKLIEALFRKFEEACYLLNNTECWSARDLQEIFGYTEWRNFVKVIDKAKTLVVIYPTILLMSTKWSGPEVRRKEKIRRHGV